ncbi:MAG: thiopurine S-methyltransferase [Methylobacter sp.]|jgi:thiopurine S-methyltransferase|nr:thiopurine S-methyltransferase [Methylobacter sp.]
MQHEFWHERWQQNQIGFHKQEINPHLQHYWSRLSVSQGDRVFVPLCGKSNDMLWLLGMGYQVVGVELSPLAVESFFSENDLKPTLRRNGDFLISEVDGLQIFCGDFFALRPADLGPVKIVYDRASLVALPADMRIKYVSSLATLLLPTTQILLITLDYPQHEMQGPPFSVQDEEVSRLFSPWCNVELLASENVLEQETIFKERGLTRMAEQTYQLVVS